MSLAAERQEFAPPPTAGLVRALVLAILAHGVLLVVLTAGVQWKRDAAPVTVEAELWSSVPQQASAPAPQEPVAPPLPPQPAPPPKPVPQPDPAIAVAKEKEKAKLLKEKQLQQEKLAQEKLALEKKKQDKLAQEKALKVREQQKDLQTKAAKDKAVQEAAQTKKLEELRQQNIKRMAGLAGSGVSSGSGDAGATGTTAQSSGPSAGYAGRIRARIKPNITYTETITSNPTAEVEVRTSPDGTIISRKLTKPSGVKAWDDAVLNAIDKTEVLPRDTDGRVPTALVISFRPKD